MEVRAELGVADHQAFTRYVWYSGARGGRVWIALILVAILSLFLFLEIKLGVNLDPSTMLFTVFILSSYLVLAQRRMRPSGDGPSLGSRTFRIDDEGIRESARHHESFTRWTGVRNVARTDDHIFVFVDNCEACILPRRSFANDTEFRRCAEELEAHVARGECAAATAPLTAVREAGC